MSDYEPAEGDVVEVVWSDHSGVDGYGYFDRRTQEHNLLKFRSFGIIEEIDDEKLVIVGTISIDDTMADNAHTLDRRCIDSVKKLLT